MIFHTFCHCRFDSSHGSSGQAAQDAPASDVADLLSGLPTSTQQPAESEPTPELIPDHVLQEPEEAPKGLPEPVMPAAEQDFSQVCLVSWRKWTDQSTGSLRML